MLLCRVFACCSAWLGEQFGPFMLKILLSIISRFKLLVSAVREGERGRATPSHNEERMFVGDGCCICRRVG